MPSRSDRDGIFLNQKSMKKILIIAALPLFAIVATSGISGTNSNAAPLGSTGAPGDFTCAKSGCHVGSELNAGLAQLNLDFNTSAQNYQPNEVYDMSVSLTQQGIERFGFQVLALNAQNENVGEFIITDSARTQTQQGVGPYQGKTYLTYKYAGTNPFSAGLGKWDFKWKAPSTNQGEIKIFVAAVAANNDGTDLGDTVYTKQFALQGTVSSISDFNNSPFNFTVFPNPATDKLTINFAEKTSENIALQISDLQGKKVFAETIHPATKGTQINVSSFAKGTYILSVQNGEKLSTQKVIIQ
jgi:hypothetical protein